MIIRKVNRWELDKEPYQVWNAFINLLATEKYESLNNIQRIAHLSFIYDAEINNGGHLQYFENQGITYLNETISALKSIGANECAEVLYDAGKEYLSKRRKRINTVSEFVRQAREGEYDGFDYRFHDCNPDIMQLLEKYLENNQSQFVKIV